MDIIAQISNHLFSFLIVLTVIVFVHELGHYLVARRCGVKVEVFSIGFGNELFGYTDKHGTRWRFSLIPLGGYVRMYGDADAASNPDAEKLKSMGDDRSLSLHSKTPLQRIAVSAAGPFANFIFSIIVLALLFMSVGQPFTEPVASEIVVGSPAEKGGLLKGDRILRVDGKKIDRYEDLVGLIRQSTGGSMEFDIERGQEKLKLSITPQMKEMKDHFGDVHKVGMIGVMSHKMSWIKHGPLDSTYYAVKQCYFMATSTLEAMGQMITGKRSSDELGGPIRIAQMSGKIAEQGIAALVAFMATLSLSLGLINLFPIPALDGGSIVIYFIEWVRGKPLSEKAQERVAIVGISIVLFLMVFSLWNDLKHLHIFEWLRALF
jgi:regulator of sigma E protease